MISSYARNYMKQLNTPGKRQALVYLWLRAMENPCENRPELTIDEALMCLVQTNFREVFGAGKGMTTDELATCLAFAARTETYVRAALAAVELPFPQTAMARVGFLQTAGDLGFKRGSNAA